MSDLNVTVLGAGVVGLTTALQLQKEIPQARVSIIADRFHKNTTSWVAAGIFQPGSSFSGPTEDITRQWIRNAYEYWQQIQRSREASKAGVTEVSGYIFSSTYPDIIRNKYIEKLVPLYRSVTEEELRLCPGTWKYGSFFTTLLTECNLFLPWAASKFTRGGGEIIEKKIDRFGDLSQNYDIIVNCTGLGAKYLCNDDRLVPLRGQVWKVEAPWIKTFFYGDHDTYIIPGFEGVTLGGCRQYESYNTDVDKHDGLAIRERCEALVPSLKNARTIGQRVGLRPYRAVARVEKEIKECRGRLLKIVHNYGHGGCGVTMAPGTAIHAVKLVKKIWRGNSKL